MKKFFYGASALFSVLVIYFLVSLSLSGFLPFKYLMLTFFVLLLLSFGLVFGMLKLKKTVIRFILFFVSLIVSLMLIIALRYSADTLAFLRGLSGLQFETTKYYGIALKDAPFDEIDGLDVLMHNNIATDVDELKEKLLELEVNFDETSNLSELDQLLFDLEYDAVVVEKNFRDILNEVSERFENETKVIFEFEVQTEIVREEVEVDVTTDAFSIYISGIDTHGSISNRARSDVNIVMTINPRTSEILLTNIPRDYYVKIPGTTGYKDKLTHAGIYGVETSRATVAELLETDIDYYLRVNFSSVVRLVDALGGINVDSSYSFRANGYNFNRGNNFMNGDQTLAFVRERKTLPGGDRARGENQQAVIEGIIKKATQRDVITRYSSILNSMENMFDTNMSSDEIVSIIRMQIANNPSWDIEQYNLDGRDSRNFTYSIPSAMAYVMEPDMETVNEARRLIKELKERGN